MLSEELRDANKSLMEWSLLNGSRDEIMELPIVLGIVDGKSG